MRNLKVNLKSEKFILWPGRFDFGGSIISFTHVNLKSGKVTLWSVYMPHIYTRHLCLIDGGVGGSSDFGI